MGPYNKELLEISALTFQPKLFPAVTTVISKKLTTLMNDYSKRRSPAVSRSNSLSRSPSLARYMAEKDSLCILKVLTVLLYLLQHGSSAYLDWIHQHCTEYVTPLRLVKFPPQYAQSIAAKVSAISRYCESPAELSQLRLNVHKLRTDFLTPGLKRLTSTSTRLNAPLYSTESRSHSLDIPRSMVPVVETPSMASSPLTSQRKVSFQ